MRKALLFLAAAFAFVSCQTNAKYSEPELVGLWVEPIPGMDKVQGVALKEGGEAHSINMATLSMSIGNVTETNCFSQAKV